MRELDLAIAPEYSRAPTHAIRVGNASMIIPKNANPSDYLPQQYHKYLRVFDQQEANALPPHRSWDHAIELQHGKQPPFQRPYGMTQPELIALREYLDKELRKGFIRVSRSPAAAPVLFVKKSDGSLRFCVDYRGLNAVTIKNRYSLPRIQETLNQLSKARYYTKLDIVSAFNKLRIKKGDEWKTAFTTRYGLFEYLVTPFGMCNAPSTFQSYINEALRGYLDQFCTAYVDDILIFSNDLLSHRRHVAQVLERLQEFGLQADISKCEFETTEVKYLGLIISTSGIRMDPVKVACVQEWPKPRNAKDIQCFLGFANFYRRFIPEFSRLATPLTQLTKKDTPFIWTDNCKSSFMQIKNAFKEGQILAHFDPSRKTILETDASDWVTAAVLSQYDDEGVLRPVAFMSKKMIPAECNYEIFDKELLAIVKAFETWTAELGSVEASTLVLTDHKNLECFMTTKKLNRRQVRWNELLSEFDFKIVFRPGKRGGKPDALTRVSTDRPANESDERTQYQYQTLLKPTQILRRATVDLAPTSVTEPALLALDPETWETACEDDLYCQEIRKAIMDKSLTRSDIQLANCSLSVHSFRYNNREYVPAPLRVPVLHQFHDTPAFGHRGSAALFALVSRLYWWPDGHKDCTKYARGCESCRRSNPSTQRPYGFLQPLPPPQNAFRHLTLDFIGPLPLCQVKGYQYRYILQIVDRLTKRVWAIPTETMTARETATCFQNNVFRFCGLPDSLVSDQGSAFIDSTWKHICETLSITHKLSTSYHPETDGQTERANKTLEVYFRHFVNYHQDNWATLLPIAEFCINNHENASTGLSPFFASFGHHPRLDFRPESREAKPRPDFVQHITDTQRICHDSIVLAQAFQASHANEKRLPAPRYKVGDKVFLSMRNLRQARPSAKLDHIRAGPYKITKMKTPLVGKLDLPSTLSRIDNNFHVSLLLPSAEGFPSQAQQEPPPVELLPDEDPYYKVEEVLDSRIYHKKLQYLVRWTGYQDPTWEPFENLENCPELTTVFHTKYPRKPTRLLAGARVLKRGG